MKGNNSTGHIDQINDSDEFIILNNGAESRLKYDTFRQLVFDNNINESNVGNKGEKGDLGSTGAKGEKGEIGLRGIFGPIGSFGEMGERGFFGEKGDKGTLGQKGIRGESGYLGEKGNIGSKGDKGSPGYKGYKGYTGQKGNKGNIGSKGFKGEPGLAGVNKIGKIGDVGIPGKKINGRKGYKGFKGNKSSVKGNPGEKGASGPEYFYDNIRRTFKNKNENIRRHGRLLTFLLSVSGSTSIAISTNEFLMSTLRQSRFMVFELVDINTVNANSYSNLYIEIDFEPFISNNFSPVLTKHPPIFCKKNASVGIVGMDWYLKDGGYNISFYSIYEDTDSTEILPMQSIYSFSNRHLNKVISGQFENLRI